MKNNQNPHIAQVESIEAARTAALFGIISARTFAIVFVLSAIAMAFARLS